MLHEQLPLGCEQMEKGIIQLESLEWCQEKSCGNEMLMRIICFCLLIRRWNSAIKCPRLCLTFLTQILFYVMVAHQVSLVWATEARISILLYSKQNINTTALRISLTITSPSGSDLNHATATVSSRHNSISSMSDAADKSSITRYLAIVTCS